MTTKMSVENTLAVAVVAAIVGVAIGVAINGNSNATTVNFKPKFSIDQCNYEVRVKNGQTMYHVFYDTDKYEYETSGITLGEAIEAMRELVTM